GRGGGGPQRRGDAEPPRDGPPRDAPRDLARGPAGATPGGAATPRGRGDAFDPSTAPGAPGSPRVLGRVDPLSGPLGADADGDPNAPLDLMGGRSGPGPSAGAGLGADPRQQAALPVDPGPAPPSGPRAEFEAAIASSRANQLEAAETGLKGFLEKYPQSQLAASATYNLGDVYARRGRHREAAENFLKVSTDFSKSSQAPMSLVRLGQSLERLGAREQACAAWAEVARKYPSSAQARAGAERDMKRASC
ncbi:MAG TPA: tol-pal system protein YbgF, partial [Beijerinckiaceae bacterium]